MRKAIMALVTGAFLLGGASAASAEPDIVKWLKDPCVPTGDLEDGCRLPLP